MPGNTGRQPDRDRGVVSYPFTFATPIGAVAGLLGGSIPGTVTITAQGVMRCGG
jgi:hypothetical protein